MSKLIENMNKNIRHVMFLVDEYHLNYKEQIFEGKPFGTYETITYSFYNDSGCFTLSYLSSREELDFYYSSKISDDYYELHEKGVNIWIDEPEIWNKHQKWFGFINDPFFWMKHEKVIKALAETIRVKINKNGEFFGVKIQ